MRKRGPKNKVEQLPVDLINLIKSRLLDGSMTIESLTNLINTHPLNQEGIKISNSSLNRYQKLFDKEMKEIQDIKTLISNLPKEFNFDDESKFHSALAGMLSKVMFEFLVTGNLSVKDLGTLSKSLENIMSSMKDREKIKADLRKEIERELKQAQADKLKTAKDGGKISKKSFEEAIRILGL